MSVCIQFLRFPSFSGSLQRSVHAAAKGVREEWRDSGGTEGLVHPVRVETWASGTVLTANLQEFKDRVHLCLGP